MQKHYLDQKLLAILVFCLFKRNCRLFFDSTGDSASERLKKSLTIGLKIFDFFYIRKFGIVDKGSDCNTKGPGFESRHIRSFKVSRLQKRAKLPLFSRAYKALIFISTIFYFAKFHYPLLIPNEWPLSKGNRFLVNYTSILLQNESMEQV